MILAAVSKDQVTPGVLGFLVTFALGVATWFLLRSMNRHLKRVDFVEEPEPGAPPKHAGEDDPA